MKIISIFVFGSSIRDEVTSLDMGGTGQKQLLLIVRESISVAVNAETIARQQGDLATCLFELVKHFSV